MHYSDMMPHQQRVVDEKLELDAKISKLDDFIGSAIYYEQSDAEQRRLCRQFDYMYGYSEKLGERIHAFGTDE